MSDLPLSVSAPRTRALRFHVTAAEGQRAYFFIALGFIIAVGYALPNPALLTVPALKQFFLFLAVSSIYGLFAQMGAHYVSTRSLNASITYGLRRILGAQNMARAAPTLLIIAAFVFSFATFKTHIPSLNPYSWDAAFAEFDRALHFGRSPWLWVFDVTGYGAFTRLMDFVYYLWFPVIFGAAAAVAMAPGNGALRHRFLLSFALAWIIIGCIFATLMSSAGPIYFDLVNGGASEFAALNAQLERVNEAAPLRAIEVRDMLWAAYTGEAQSVISGISAMPSMHNAVCVLLFLAARHISPWLAAAAALYGLAIFIGSIHLGWHYAVDAYAAAILTAAIWKAAGFIAGREAARIQTA
jgi:hypothetical protein